MTSKSFNHRATKLNNNVCNVCMCVHVRVWGNNAPAEGARLSCDTLWSDLFHSLCAPELLLCRNINQLLQATHFTWILWFSFQSKSPNCPAKPGDRVLISDWLTHLKTFRNTQWAHTCGRAEISMRQPEIAVQPLLGNYITRRRSNN